MEKWGVYILKGKRYYVGYTGDLEKRLREYKKGTTIMRTRVSKIHRMGK